MVYVCLHELLVESVEQLGVTKATLVWGSGKTRQATARFKALLSCRCSSD